MTMHSCKGLEFKVVYILDANEGITPHHKAVLEPDMEEERRMFYVAMTRAKRPAAYFYVKERYHKRQTVSRFVVEAELLGDKGDMEKNGNSNKKNKWTTGKKIKRWKLLKGQVAWCIFTAGTEKAKRQLL